ELLAREVHPRLADGGVEPEEVLEQPDAGDAVDGGDAEGDARQRLAAERQEPRGHLRVVEVGEAAGLRRPGDADAGGALQPVVAVEAAADEQLVDGAAAGAAEALAAALDRVGAAWQPAVGARRL